jgi:hypothetical protein
VTDRTEQRLSDALAALRAQSRAPVGGFDEVRDRAASVVELSAVPIARRRSPRALAGLVAAAGLLVATLVIAVGGDDGTVETRPAGEPISHADLIDRALAECAAFQAAAPDGPPPFNQGLEPLRRWHAQYTVALQGTDDVYVEVVPSAQDSALVDTVRATLGQQRAAAIRAGDALDDGNETLAFDEIAEALRYGEQVGFVLAEAGAEACDARGVTQSTR